MAKTDYYRVLRVYPHGDARDIDDAYWNLAHIYHRRLGTNPTAARRLEILNEAYETLGIPDKRRAYDRKRARGNGHGRGRLGRLFDLLSRLF